MHRLPIILLLVTALHAPPEDLTWTHDGDTLRLQFDERDGTPLEEFLAFATTQSDARFVFDPREVRDVRIRIIGPQRVRADEIEVFVGAVLRAHDFVCETLRESPRVVRVRAAAESARRHRRGTCCQAPVVAHTDLERYRDDRATLIQTAIPLTSRSPCDVVGDVNAWCGRSASWIRAHETRRAVVVVGFGHDAWRAARFVRAIDRATRPPVTCFDLEHADADGVLRALDELRPADEAARITAVPRTDRLLVVGEAVEFAAWIAALDVPPDA